MDPNFLEFEQPIAELQAKISELRYVTDDSDINISQEIQTLERKAESLTVSIFSKLSAWQISQLSRHPNRPYTTDYIERMFTDFEYLHGDRAFANDHPIIGGMTLGETIASKGFPVIEYGVSCIFGNLVFDCTTDETIALFE